jgi:hypothetical protein
MNRLGVWMRPVGHCLLRCLVGKYGTILWIGMVTVLVGAGAYLSLVYDHSGSGGADQGTVYSVAAVNAHLAQDPGLWLGRTIQVRGEIEPCTIIQRGDRSCPVLASDPGEIDRLDQSTSPIGNPIPVGRAGLDPVRSVLRWVPLLGRLVSSPQELHWGVVATYTVRLAAIPDSMCGASACVEARLLDSAP